MNPAPSALLPAFNATLTHEGKSFTATSSHSLGVALWATALKLLASQVADEPAEETAFPADKPKRKPRTKKQEGA